MNLLTIRATGEAWTAFDDVPRFGESFDYTFEVPEDTSVGEVYKKVRMRSTPHVGFLLNLIVALVVNPGGPHELEIRLTEPSEVAAPVS